MRFRILAALATALGAAAVLGAEDGEVFLREGGCRASGQGAEFHCPEGSELAAVGCDRGAIRDDLAALTPAAPIVLCLEYSTRGPQRGEYLQGPRGLRPLYSRFVVAEADGFHLLGSVEALRRRYAPIESADEALAFALAATGLVELRGFERIETYRYFLDEISDTRVSEEEGGYLVRNLKHYKQFGCGPHPTSLVTVRVTTEGTVEELSRERAFENPATDRLCVD